MSVTTTTINVTEAIRHGAFSADRTVEVPADANGMAYLLGTSEYHYSVDRAPALLAELLATGTTSHGWSTFSVVA